MDLFCDNLRAYLDGKPLHNVIDWNRGDQARLRQNLAGAGGIDPYAGIKIRYERVLRRLMLSRSIILS